MNKDKKLEKKEKKHRKFEGESEKDGTVNRTLVRDEAVKQDEGNKTGGNCVANACK